MKFFEALANVFRDSGSAQAAAVRAGAAGGVSPRRAHSDSRRRREPAGGLLARSNAGSVFGMFDLFSGGMLPPLTIFALGIMPYITASIILQLLTVVVPTLEKLQKEGELGRRKITQWTRYLTVDPGAHAVASASRPRCKRAAGPRHESRHRIHR